jgi:hypothetical protein
MSNKQKNKSTKDFVEKWNKIYLDRQKAKELAQASSLIGFQRTLAVEEAVIIEAIKVLGFNPASKTEDSFIGKILPEQAYFILDFLNGDNRKLSEAQVNAIRNSLREDGWLFDGQPLTFNDEGNITEWQHRAAALILENMVAKPTPIVVGVLPECFSKTAPNKARKAKDEIHRADKSVRDDEVTTLGGFLKLGNSKLTIKNAVVEWDKHKVVVRAGRELAEPFIKATDKFSPWKKNFAAWCAAMIFIDQTNTAKDFLSLLKGEILKADADCCLTREFKQMWETQNSYLSNTGRAELTVKLLWAASDKLIKQQDGNIQLGYTSDQLTHEYLRGNTGSKCYRKFLKTFKTKK